MPSGGARQQEELITTLTQTQAAALEQKEMLALLYPPPFHEVETVSSLSDGEETSVELSACEGPEVVGQAGGREQGGSPGRAPRRTLSTFGLAAALLLPPAAASVVPLALCNSRRLLLLLLLSPVLCPSIAAHHCLLTSPALSCQ